MVPSLQKTVLIPITLVLAAICAGAAGADELPLDRAIVETTFQFHQLRKTFDGHKIPLLATEANRARSPKEAARIARTSEHEPGSKEKERADLFCKRLGYNSATKDVMTRVNIEGFALYDIDRQDVYLPELCIEESQDIRDRERTKRFWEDDTIVDSYLQLRKRERANGLCNEKVIDYALKKSIVIDTCNITEEEATRMKEKAAARIGAEPGLLMRSSYFVRITCTGHRNLTL